MTPLIRNSWNAETGFFNRHKEHWVEIDHQSIANGKLSSFFRVNAGKWNREFARRPFYEMVDSLAIQLVESSLTADMPGVDSYAHNSRSPNVNSG